MLTRVNTQNAVLAAESVNEQLVNDALVASYGDKAAEVLSAKAAELGTTVKALQQQSRENPKLVLAAFGQQSAPSGPTTGSVNIPATRPTNDGKVTAPEKSLLSGSTDREKVAFLRQIREEVYKEHDITG